MKKSMNEGCSQKPEVGSMSGGVFKEGGQSQDLGTQGLIIWKDNVKLMGPG